jgi:hypothetical protein
LFLTHRSQTDPRAVSTGPAAAAGLSVFVVVGRMTRIHHADYCSTTRLISQVRSEALLPLV